MSIFKLFNLFNSFNVDRLTRWGSTFPKPPLRENPCCSWHPGCCSSAVAPQSLLDQTRHPLRCCVRRIRRANDPFYEDQVADRLVESDAIFAYSVGADFEPDSPQFAKSRV